MLNRVINSMENLERNLMKLDNKKPKLESINSQIKDSMKNQTDCPNEHPETSPIISTKNKVEHFTVEGKDSSVM